MSGANENRQMRTYTSQEMYARLPSGKGVVAATSRGGFAWAVKAEKRVQKIFKNIFFVKEGRA